ncbi:ubiquinone/menaquinone biosynthesis methylase [Leptospira ryugenii]|uniref:Demethylmenaquinone methyltransferase n=1 Tax=Leptospira ryugenii TaxID=1917863 RepID=A0A2P2E563_9LEPT|nr:ubiquinone/menaquinone biosynthesis methyltransferase [Leptospira ryugenii]GBF52008.1 ubiquinone/menaquinone biosynthesis methylase [Leptospira ryugenii]
MSQYQLPSPEKKPEYVKSNFDDIAKAYDRFNDWNSFFLHRNWKNWLVDQIKTNTEKPTVGLDLCCGTGDITKRLRETFPKTVQIIGLDFSENMLSYAKHKLNEDDTVKLIVGDAMNLKDFSDGSVDFVSMGFGLRNVSDLHKCLKEIHRILKPDGVFINLDVGKVKPKFLKFFADFYFFKIVPIFGYLIFGSQHEMFDYLPHSSTTYPDQDTLLKILVGMGFKEVRYRNFVFGNAVAHIAKKS